MTPRERLLASLSGRAPDRMPFVIWNNKLPGGEIERALLELETCVIVKSAVYSQRFEGADGAARTVRDYETAPPAG